MLQVGVLYVLLFADYYSSIQLDSERDSDLNRILQESKEHLACQDIIVFDNRSGKRSLYNNSSYAIRI